MRTIAPREMVDTPDRRLGFWESRSTLGFAAGSGDVNLKRLEIKAIHQSLGEPATVLDAGCGNAFTLVELASRLPSSRLFGFDYSAGMVKAGLELIQKNQLADRVDICKASLLDEFPSSLSALQIPSSGFDAIYTERSIINLDTFDQQCQAVSSLWGMLAHGGRLVLCEAFIDGLLEINSFRESVGLEKINAPWHNRYLSISEIASLLHDTDATYTVNEFSGSYYFVSRVVHAREAFLNGAEPSTAHL